MEFLNGKAAEKEWTRPQVVRKCVDIVRTRGLL